MAPDEDHRGTGGGPQQNCAGEIIAGELLGNERAEDNKEKQPRYAEHGKGLNEPVGHPCDKQALGFLPTFWMLLKSTLSIIG
jgi:hypothetical protein